LSSFTKPNRAANHPHVTHDQVGSLISDGLRVIDHLKQQETVE